MLTDSGWHMYPAVSEFRAIEYLRATWHKWKNERVRWSDKCFYFPNEQLFNAKRQKFLIMKKHIFSRWFFVRAATTDELYFSEFM